MIRIPGVPFLPGTTLRDISKTDFRRSQKFMTLNGIQMLSDKPSTDEYESPSLYPLNIGPKLPSWIVYDKKVLCFYGYFKETLPEVNLAPYQVRKVKILYYLEDGTIQISEPKTENSGIPQGCLVSRQRIPRLSSSECKTSEFISILDLNVNQTVRIFDRVYFITGCDEFTRRFLNRAGIPVPDPIDTEVDPSEELRRKSSIRPKHSRISKESRSFEQFLKYDKQILKFYGYWQEKTELGEFHNLEIYYYLADDTIEIKEVSCPGVFLKRGKLPKRWNGMPLPGEIISHRPVLNVLGKSFGAARYLEDYIDTGKNINYYKDCDLMIGEHLNIFGRDVVLTDCDEFTKDYYRKKYGIENFIPLTNPAINQQKSQKLNDILIKSKHEQRELPPWNGWGTHEDSEQNCLFIEPKPPQIDMRKFFKYDRLILRFGAKMVSKIKENSQRVFIISYYLSDNTIQIYELAERNSGFQNGEFIKRSKILLPNQNLYSSARPKCYRPYHFFIGATLNLRDYIFHIVSADEYTLQYMENHPNEFPYANVEEILSKIRNALQSNYKNFISKYIEDVTLYNGCSTMTYDKIHKLLIDLLGERITDHEIITICRYFSITKPSSLSSVNKCYGRDKIRSIVHWEINRNLWNDFERLKEYIYHIDTKNTGFIDEKKLRSIILGSHLPFNQDLIDAIFAILNRNSKSEIEIDDFINFIDLNETAKPIQPLNIAFELCSKIPFLKNEIIIDWDQFLEKINLEKELKKQIV